MWWLASMGSGSPDFSFMGLYHRLANGSIFHKPIKTKRKVKSRNPYKSEDLLELSFGKNNSYTLIMNASKFPIKSASLLESLKKQFEKINEEGNDYVDFEKLVGFDIGNKKVESVNSYYRRKFTAFTAIIMDLVDENLLPADDQHKNNQYVCHYIVRGKKWVVFRTEVYDNEPKKMGHKFFENNNMDVKYREMLEFGRKNYDENKEVQETIKTMILNYFKEQSSSDLLDKKELRKMWESYSRNQNPSGISKNYGV